MSALIEEVDPPTFAEALAASPVTPWRRPPEPRDWILQWEIRCEKESAKPHRASKPGPSARVNGGAG